MRHLMTIPSVTSIIINRDMNQFIQSIKVEVFVFIEIEMYAEKVYLFFYPMNKKMQ